MMRSRFAITLAVLLSFSLAACSAGKSADPNAPAKTKEEVAAEKAKAKEDAAAAKVPPPPADSPLAKIKRDMTDAEVRQILGPPTSTKSYESGKRWIPYYGAFSTDQRRTEWTYKGMGLVTFSQNQYNGGLFVRQVVYDPKR